MKKNLIGIIPVKLISCLPSHNCILWGQSKTYYILPDFILPYLQQTINLHRLTDIHPLGITSTFHMSKASKNHVNHQTDSNLKIQCVLHFSPFPVILIHIKLLIILISILIFLQASLTSTRCYSHHIRQLLSHVHNVCNEHNCAKKLIGLVTIKKL